MEVALINSNENHIEITYGLKDYISDLIRCKNMLEAVTYFDEVTKLFEQAHPMYPSYIYKTVKYGNKTVLDHVPINEQAAKERPLTYKGQFIINKKHLGTAKNLDELLTKAMIKQEEIEIDVQHVETWIGDTKLEDDEGTLIKEAAKTARWFIIPDELPPPIKVKLVKTAKEDISIFDYIELSISDIDKEKGITVLDNSKQQSSSLLFSITINHNGIRKKIENGKFMGNVVVVNSNINVSIKTDHKNSVKAHRSFLNYVLHTLQGGELRAVYLESGADFIKVKKHKLLEKATVKGVRKQLHFLDTLLRIEEYFAFKFDFPEKVTKVDEEAVSTLRSIVDEKLVEGTFTDMVLEMTDPKGLGDLISIFNEQKHVHLMIAATMTDPVEVFGQSISKVRMENRFNNLAIENFEKLKQKHSYMDEGEMIKVKLIPGSNNKVKSIYTLEDE